MALAPTMTGLPPVRMRYPSLGTLNKIDLTLDPGCLNGKTQNCEYQRKEIEMKLILDVNGCSRLGSIVPPEHPASGETGSGSEARADAVSRRLDAFGAGLVLAPDQKSSWID
jgi:hypothetical protein